MNKIDVSTFEKLISKKFKVGRATIAEENNTSAIPPKNTSLELMEAKEEKRDTHNTISLIFHSSAEIYLPQMTYSLSTDEFAPRDIFIVPIGELTEGTGADAKKIGYKCQAIFSELNEG